MEKDKAVGSGMKWSRFLKAVPPWGFADPRDEELYTTYTHRQRMRVVPRLLAVFTVFNIYVFLIPGEAEYVIGVLSATIGTAFNLVLLIVFLTTHNSAKTLAAHYTWLYVWFFLLFNVSRRVGDTYNELLGWAVVMQYLTIAELPFHYIVIIIYSVLSLVGYLLVQFINALRSETSLPEDFLQQEATNFAMLLSASILGGISYIVAERQQRTSFQETKQSLKDKLTIEQQSKEQERLLLSVLPEHVAVQMRQELGLIDTQFKKIYMSRHENVSILYADIVGFTAISSTYSAQDLVAILNELFARFDRLAEKYHQLRIKILGDCYYCISGAPVERPDHAVLCIHMGLSMVKAIKYVQQTTNSPVDMRVGIHTGAVLAGVLGQRQWQFDVYSRDVELANKMESSGKAGRVHISEATLGYLQDEFEVEPAYGERREEMLRQAGVKTYFIVRVLKPFVGEGGGEGGDDYDGEGGDSELRDEDDDSILSPQDESNGNEGTKITDMLEEELVNRDDDKELAEGTTLCLTFKSSSMEDAYRRGRDECPQAIVAPSLVLLPPVVLMSSFAVPPSWSLNAVFLALILETGLLNVLYYAMYRYLSFKKKDVSPYWKLTCGVFNIAMFVSANIAPLIICGYYESVLDDGLNEDALSHTNARRCAHPSYYYHVGAGAICGLLLISPVGWITRSVLLLLIAAAYAVPSFLTFSSGPHALPSLLEPNPYSHSNSTYPVIFQRIYPALHSERNIIMLFMIASALLLFHRYTEGASRARAVRRWRTAAQAAQAGELRRRNVALVHNVLPPHVATHFVGARRHHRDLYSQSYHEVAVLFASMPNFTEFYSEESVNNQGLECLRFLNEVISDFDLLLEDARFSKDIIKIKTISSTYMAASGLNPVRQMQPSDSVLVRWAHLANLVEFALELQRVLAAINEQSFNHFVLRMGVNHGPITAGVIGARKPHYDIWGNTVNVASRMESTGKAGCIQVTEETCQILQQFGYYFEQRGLVAVKGKGQLMTYYLQGKREFPVPDTPSDTPHIPCEDNADDNVTQALLANTKSPPKVLEKRHNGGSDACLLPV